MVIKHFTLQVFKLNKKHKRCKMTLSLQPECNILKNLTCEQYKHIRGGMIK